MYQVLPERARLSVQTAVEGIGVPVAIGISGVLILVLNVLPFALAATIVVTTIVCAVWTWTGSSSTARTARHSSTCSDVSRSSTRTPILEAARATPPSPALAGERLGAHGPPRHGPAGIDDVTARWPPSSRVLARDPLPDVRMAALGGLVGAGDEGARRRAGLRGAVSGQRMPTPRHACGRRGSWGCSRPSSGQPRSASLIDADPDVRSAALDAVRHGDVAAVAPAIAALDDPSTLGAASGAIERLGDAVLGPLADALGSAGTPAHPRVLRLVRSAATASAGRDELLRRYVGHRDRELGLAVIERLVAAEPASEATAVALDAVLAADIRHAAGVLAAMAAFEGEADGEPAMDPSCGPWRTSWTCCARASARACWSCTARRGSGRRSSRSARAGRTPRLLARRSRSCWVPLRRGCVLTLLEPGLAAADRLARFRATASDAPGVEAVLRDLVEDADDRWRSPWLRACAIHAARARGALHRIDLFTTRALGDPIVDEELSISGA